MSVRLSPQTSSHGFELGQQHESQAGIQTYQLIVQGQADHSIDSTSMGAHRPLPFIVVYVPGMNVGNESESAILHWVELEPQHRSQAHRDANVRAVRPASPR